MNEDLGDILKNGFQTWKNNLITCVPFLLSAILIILLVLGLLIFVIFLMAGSLSSLGYTLTSSLSNLPILSFFLLILLVIIFVVVISLIDAFFEAGAIGMAKEATQKGKTSLDDMMQYGKKKVVSLFLANLLVGIIILVGVIILLGCFIGIPYLFGFFSGYGGMNLWLLLFIILGICLTLLYLLITAIIFSPVKYALVVSDLGAIAGVEEGYNFFKKHKLDVFLMWLIVLAVGLGLSAVSFILRLPLSFIPLLGVILSVIISILTALTSVLVIAPLTAIWWTRLYLNRIEKSSQVVPPAKEIPPQSEQAIYI